jgi:hypothetical protein
MNIHLRILFSALLLGSVIAQTNFNNTCQNSSLLPLLATGSITLNPLDTYNSASNKDYYQDLSLAQFQATDVLGYGFALSAFQTSCGQSYYTLVVDKVDFENQNTRMRLTINFLNPSTFGTSTTLTKWNIVTFTYIVVSRNFNGAYTNIWATTAEAAISADINPPALIDKIASAFNSPLSGCYTYVDPNYLFNPSACLPNHPWSSTAANGGIQIVHAYIMGFQWNSISSTTAFLGAGVFSNNPTAASFDSSQAEVVGSNSFNWNIQTNLGTVPEGPSVYVNSQNGALQYIKVAFVYSVFDAYYVPNQSTFQNTPSNYYPGSVLSYSSSYVFDKVAHFNTATPIKQGNPSQTVAPTITYNQHYMRLPDARYAIYGLTSFSFPQNANSSCTTSISVSTILNSINTYTINTPNPNPTNFYFSADIFTVNVDNLCIPSDGSSPFAFVSTIGNKNYFTVPTQSIQQFIQEWPVSITAPGVPNPTDPNAASNTLYSGVSADSTPNPLNKLDPTYDLTAAQ